MEREWESITDEEFARQLAEATERGARADATEPRAIAARYNRRTGRVEVELRNGCLFAFPAAMTQGLREATPEQLEAAEVWSRGAALHWEELDEDLGVPQLLEGRFGGDRWMARWGGSGWNAPEVGATPAEPRAVSARYNREAGRIELELRNGCLFAFPPALVQDLGCATPDQLAAVRIAGNGASLLWSEPDVAISVTSLLEGRYGTTRYMAQWGGSGWNAPDPRAASAETRTEPERRRKAS